MVVKNEGKIRSFKDKVFKVFDFVCCECSNFYCSKYTISAMWISDLLCSLYDGEWLQFQKFSGMRHEGQALGEKSE